VYCVSQIWNECLAEKSQAEACVTLKYRNKANYKPTYTFKNSRKGNSVCAQSRCAKQRHYVLSFVAFQLFFLASAISFVFSVFISQTLVLDRWFLGSNFSQTCSKSVTWFEKLCLGDSANKHRLHQWIPNFFVRGTPQGYFKWTRSPRQNCRVNINAFSTQIAVIKLDQTI